MKDPTTRSQGRPFRPGIKRSPAMDAQSSRNLERLGCGKEKITLMCILTRERKDPPPRGEGRCSVARRGQGDSVYVTSVPGAQLSLSQGETLYPANRKNKQICYGLQDFDIHGIICLIFL